MSKVLFCCNSGANAFSTREDVIDTVVDLGMLEGEWEGMCEDEQHKIVSEWAWEHLEIYWKEVA